MSQHAFSNTDCPGCGAELMEDQQGVIFFCCECDPDGTLDDLVQAGAQAAHSDLTLTTLL